MRLKGYGLDSTGLPLWTPQAQLALYDALGYKRGHPEQDRFLLDWERRLHVVICPRRSSKSYTAAKKALPIVLGREALPDGSGPKPTRTWIVGPTYELAEKEFRYLWDDLMRVGPKLGWPKPVLARDSKKGGDLFILTAWGSTIVGKSADKPQSLLGEEVDCLIMSEAATMPADVWFRYLEPTLSTTQGYAIFPTTPDAGALWLHELWLKGLGGDEPSIASYTWPVTGNPIYPVKEFDEKRRFYGEAHPVFQEQYLGRWTFYSGTVYGHDFDPARNIREPFLIPPEWRRIRGIDFGYRDPFVCLWFAVAEDSLEHKTQKGELILYREYYQQGRAMAEHAEILRGLSKDERILYTVADSSEAQSIADLRRLGVPAFESNRDRRAGRLLVGDAFRTGRLTLVRGACPNTIRELSFYRWDKDRDKEGAKELTVGDDHAMDAMRYAVMSRPQPRTLLARTPKGSFAYEMQIQKMERERAVWPTMAR